MLEHWYKILCAAMLIVAVILMGVLFAAAYMPGHTETIRLHGQCVRMLDDHYRVVRVCP